MRPLTITEISEIKYAMVVPSIFESWRGKSICFHIKGGGMKFLPLVWKSKLRLGHISLKSIGIVEKLNKDGVTVPLADKLVRVKFEGHVIEFMQNLANPSDSVLKNLPKYGKLPGLK